MAYLEKNFQTDFAKFCKNLPIGHTLRRSATFELKISDGESIPFADVKEHQANSLRITNEGVFFYKPPDNTGYQNPCDVIMLVEEPSYVVIMFKAQERNRKEFVVIPFENWKKEEQISTRRSLLLSRAAQIGLVFSLN